MAVELWVSASFSMRPRVEVSLASLLLRVSDTAVPRESVRRAHGVWGYGARSTPT
jgi:hypothetical protein